jgi:S1-C subfamily serine protease
VSAIPAVKLSKPVADFQEQLVRVVDSVSPAVVQIQTSGGLGSGVVYDSKGNIITNAHVVGTFKTFKITLANGTYDGTLVGSFPANDLAGAPRPRRGSSRATSSSKSTGSPHRRQTCWSPSSPISGRGSKCP